MEKRELLVDEKRALEILGVKPSTLRALIRSGMIDPIKSDKGRTRMYYVAELMATRASRAASRTLIFNVREEVMTLAAQVQNLTRDLKLMAQQIGLPHIGYSPTDSTLTNLYHVALSVKGTMTTKRPTIAFLNQWLSVVPLLTDQEYRRLTRLFPGDNHPWREFYLATSEMIGAMSVHYNLEIDVAMQVMRTRLVLCLDRIRMSALVFLAIEEPKQDPVRRMSEVVQSPYGNDPSFEAKRLLNDLQLVTLDPDQSTAEMLDSVQADQPIPASGTPQHLNLPALMDQPTRRR